MSDIRSLNSLINAKTIINEQGGMTLLVYFRNLYKKYNDKIFIYCMKNNLLGGIFIQKILIEHARSLGSLKLYLENSSCTCKRYVVQGVPPICWQVQTKFWKLKNHICQKVSPVLKSSNKNLLDDILKPSKIKLKVFLNWISKKVSNLKNGFAPCPLIW